MPDPSPRQLPPPPDDAPAVAPEPEPESVPAPWAPLAPGELLAHVVDGGGVREQDLPAGSRAQLAAYRAAQEPAAAPGRAPDRATLQERAQRILSERLGALEGILSDPRADPADVTRAMTEVRAIAGARAEAPKQARALPDVLQDMATALREHGYTVAEPAEPRA